MKIALITGSGGLIGSQCVEFFSNKGFQCVGIDNDFRQYFFGREASTEWNSERLKKTCPGYVHYALDIRDARAVDEVFSRYSSDIRLVIHTAAQPSHDWAAKEPFTDFTVNANGTLTVLEAARKHCTEAVFIFTSTNKVYGDTPNRLPLIELDTRWEIDPKHPYAQGIDETMSIDQTTHSLFGASKVAADVLTQEYGRYFGMKTAVFRGGCLTGPRHSGAMLHGFLSYLVKCAVSGTRYTILGYKGKQVRDNIHCYDLVNMFWHFYQNPRPGEVYNAGGGRHSNCSMQEAVNICEELTNRKMDIVYSDQARIGDHIWWISGVQKFQSHFPEWKYQYSIRDILREMVDQSVADASR